MTEILCSWLNDEIKISQVVDKKSISSTFANGYLIGEVLSKYGLQNDFDFFSQSNTADSKLNNFTRLEPTVLLLGIPFDVNVARDIMAEKSGTATKLLYQLFIALENKRKAGLTGVAMETMRSAAPAKLANMEIGLYRERIKQITPRQTDINLQEIVKRFHQHRLKLEERAFNLRIQSAERHRSETDEHRRRMMDRSKNVRDQQKDLMDRLEAAKVCIPKPPPNRTADAIQRKKNNLIRLENNQALFDLEKFDERLQRNLQSTTSSDALPYFDSPVEDNADLIEWIKPASNEDYIGRIRQRLEDDAFARGEREKRRRKVLVDCLNAHHKQAEEQQEEALARRLMRQSQIEKRIAVQLLQTRHEKTILKRNRLLRERQYQERREREFIEAMDKEQELYRQAILACSEQLKADQELHEALRAKESERKYHRNYEFCDSVFSSIVDMSCRVAEYREFLRSQDSPLPNRGSRRQEKLPLYIYRNLLTLFRHGKPFYETQNQIDFVTAEGLAQGLNEEQMAILRNERERVLDESELLEYRNMSGDWNPPTEIETFTVPSNPILGWIIDKLHKKVYPAPPPNTAPTYPSFPIKAAILGKSFSGKSSVIKSIAANNFCVAIQVDELIKEALDALAMNEMVSEEVEVPIIDDELTDSPDKTEPDEEAHDDATLKSDKETFSKTKVVVEQRLSDRAQIGDKISQLLKKGKIIDDQLLVDLIAEYLKRLPSGCGWILDGFPATYNQAKLLEKQLTGFNEEVVNVNKKSAKGKKGTPATGPLTSNPRPEVVKTEILSGLDTVILLDIEDVNLIRRATGRFESSESHEQYHLLDSPPPEGSMTGMMGSVETVKPIADPANDMDQLQKRLTYFLESWPKLEKFYNTTFRVPLIGNFVKVVAADCPLENLSLEVEKLLDEAMHERKVRNATESVKSLGELLEKMLESGELQPPPLEDSPLASLPVAEEPPLDPSAVTASPPEGKRSGKKGSPKGSRTSSRKGSPKEAKRKSSKGSPPRPVSSTKRKETGSAGSNSPKRGRSASKRSKTPPKEPDAPEKVEPTGPKTPEPGSEDWQFVDQTLPIEVCSVLMHLWETIESSYLNNAQGMFRLLRADRENIIQYFYRVRVHFLEYLRRPDTKQEFVAQFQKDFNEISDELRGDEEIKQELYQRVDDLRDKLFEISDVRKDAAEKRRSEILSSGWLDDAIGLLTNHYLSLMQGEFHRFQDSGRLLKDYYSAMKTGTPLEFKPDYVRLPLLELPIESERRRSGSQPGEDEPSRTAAGTPTSSDNAQQPSGRPASGRSGKSGRTGSPKGGRKASPASKKGKGGKGGGKETEKEAAAAGESGVQELTDSEIDAMFKTRIPLLSLRPSSTDILNALNSTAPVATTGANTAAAGANKAAAGKGGKPAAGGGKDKGGKAAGGTQGGAGAAAGNSSVTDWVQEGPQAQNPPQDPDLRTLHSAYKSGLQFMTSVISQELASLEAAEEADRLQQQEREKERERIANEKKAAAMKAQGGKAPAGKGKKSRSPSPKKRDATPPPADTPVTYATEEEKEEIERNERMRKEYFAALLNEAKGTRVRMVLILYVANAVIEDLKGKSENVFKDLLDWIGSRILKENELIEGLTEVLRTAIENQERLREKLQLSGENFYVDRENTVVEPTQAPERPQPIDVIEANEFKIRQLRSIYNTLSRVAPSGHMAVSEFNSMLQELRDLCEEPNSATIVRPIDVTERGMIGLVTNNSLPEPWKNALPTQLTELAEALSWDHEYVDWRRFLLSISMHAHPRPTQKDLLLLLQEYHTMDEQKRGFITKEQYFSVPLWLEKNYRPPSTPLDPVQPKKVDRVSELKLLIFDMFKEQRQSLNDENNKQTTADQDEGNARVIYIIKYCDMLMHFCAHPSAHHGFERALSVRIGKPVPHLTWTNRLNKELYIEEDQDEESEALEDVDVPMECLLDVVLFGKHQSTETSSVVIPGTLDDTVSQKEDSVRGIMELSYRQLGSHDVSPLPYSLLLTHSYILEILSACKQYLYIDPKQHLGDGNDTNSSRTEKGNE